MSVSKYREWANFEYILSNNIILNILQSLSRFFSLEKIFHFFCLSKKYFSFLLNFIWAKTHCMSRASMQYTECRVQFLFPGLPPEPVLPRCDPRSSPFFPPDFPVWRLFELLEPAPADMSRRPPPDIGGMTSLKIDNLSYRTDAESLRRTFSKFGDIGDVYIPKDKHGGTHFEILKPMSCA